MFNAGSYPISVAEMSNFISDADWIFTKEEYEDLIFYLAKYPEAGDVIPGTGGVRKMRWPARGQGKRGGARVIYYFRDLNVPLYLLAAYAKGEKLNITAREKVAMSIMVDELVTASMGRRLRVVRNS
jgi:hypothetical protein